MLTVDGEYNIYQKGMGIIFDQRIYMLLHFRKVSTNEEVKDDLSLHELTQAVSFIRLFAHIH